MNQNSISLSNNQIEINKMKESIQLIEDENRDLRFQIESNIIKELDTEAILNNETLMQQIITKSS